VMVAIDRNKNELKVSLSDMAQEFGLMILKNYFSPLFSLIQLLPKTMKERALGWP